MAESLAMARHLAAVADPWDQRYREGSDGWEGEWLGLWRTPQA